MSKRANLGGEILKDMKIVHMLFGSFGDENIYNILLCYYGENYVVIILLISIVTVLLE